MPRSRPKKTAQATPTWRIETDFNLGGEQAETDVLLADAFVESGPYRAIASRSDPRCFLVGRTGSGKTAILRRLEIGDPDHVIRISPEDLSLQYITDLGVIRYLDDLQVRLDPFFSALWKHVLVIEIIKHRYGVESEDMMRRFLNVLMDRVRRDRKKQAALEYLRDFEGRFWQETDEQIKEITRSFEEKINAEAGGKLVSPVARTSSRVGSQRSTANAERAELAQRFQRVVNDTQLPRLNHMISVLAEDVLDAQHFTYVIVDDLDRDWADERVANDLIRCLFRAVMDLKKVRNLKVLVALRTNIVEKLDFGRLGGQQEKYRSLTMQVRWSGHDLRNLLDHRARVAAAHHGATHVTGIADLLPPPDGTRGDPLDWCLSKTLLRPRDAISFLNQCFGEASGRSRLDWTILHAAELSYSTNRLKALSDEWRPTYPRIDQILEAFREQPRRMNPAELARLLDKCLDEMPTGQIRNQRWLNQINTKRKRAGAADPVVALQPLIQILYNIGFLGYSLGRRNPDTYSHEEPDAMDRDNTLRQAGTFIVHPTFQRALDML